MSAPDLKSPEGLRAYRNELWRVARWWRWTGLGLVALGAIGLVMACSQHLPLFGSALGTGAVFLLAIGWGLAIVGIVIRTRYHKRRMAGWDGE